MDNYQGTCDFVMIRKGIPTPVDVVVSREEAQCAKDFDAYLAAMIKQEETWKGYRKLRRL